MRSPLSPSRRRKPISFRLQVEPLEFRRLLATITVTGTGDTIAKDGVVTLREAITAANTNAASGDAAAGDAGLDTINFDIPGPGVHTIRLASDLPTISEPLIIDGYTQGHSTSNPSGGASPNTNPVNAGSNAVLLIELAPGSVLVSSGLRIAAPNSTVRGLAINRFGNGIVLLQGGGDTVAGNYLGTDPAGTMALGNGVDLSVESPNNTIGGTSPADRNLISGGTIYGIYVPPGTSRSGTVIRGNFIGTDATGMRGLPNQFGVSIEGGAGATTIGGVAAGARNLISGNSTQGVYLVSQAGDLIQGNFIGPDVTGTARIGNGDFGLTLFFGHDNTIGGTSAGAGNVIATNTPGIQARGSVGLHLDGAINTLVQGNSIGTDVTGTIDLGNSSRGVSLVGAADRNTIGGTSAGAGNTIAFSQSGVGLAGFANAVLGNSIFGNTGAGIIADESSPFLPPPPSLNSASGTSIAGTHMGLPGATFRLEFFATPDTGAASRSQGKTFLGTMDVTGDGTGLAGFTFAPVGGVPAGRLLTATATDPKGTSGFSAAIVAAAAPVAPTNVVPSLQTAGDGSVSLILLWSHEIPVGDPITFNVYRSTTPGGEGSVPQYRDISARSLHDAGVVRGSTYYYQVSAVVGGVESPRSTEVHVTIPTVAVPPTPSYFGVYQDYGPVSGYVLVAPGSFNPTYRTGAIVNFYRSATPGGEGTVPFQAGTFDVLSESRPRARDARTFYFQVSVSVDGVESPRTGEIAVTVPALAVPPVPQYFGVYQDYGPVSGYVLVAPGSYDPTYRTGAIVNFYRSATPGGEGTVPFQAGTFDVLTESRPLVRDAQTLYYQVSVSVDGVESPRTGEIAVTVPALGPLLAPNLFGYFAAGGPTQGHFYLQPSFPYGYLNRFPNSFVRIYESSTPGGEGPTPYATSGATTPWRMNVPLSRSSPTFYFRESLVVNGVEGPRSNEVAITVPALLVGPSAPTYTASYQSLNATGGFVIVRPYGGNFATKYPIGSTWNFYKSNTPGGEGDFPDVARSPANFLKEFRGRSRDDRHFYFQVSVTLHGVEGPRSREVAVTVPALPIPRAPTYTASYQNRDATTGFIHLQPAGGIFADKYPGGATWNFYGSAIPGREIFDPERSSVNFLNDIYSRVSGDRPYYYQVSVTVNGVEGPRSKEVSATVPALSSVGDSKRVVAVTSLYAKFLHRSPESAGLQFWTSQLKQGVPLAVVTKAIQASPEARGLTHPRP